MDIAFEDKRIRLLCDSNRAAVKAIGKEAAELLKHRLADIEAAVTISDLLLGSPRIIGEPPDPKVILGLCDGYRLTFKANHGRLPLLPSGMLDWSRVSRVKIVSIEK